MYVFSVIANPQYLGRREGPLLDRATNYTTCGLKQPLISLMKSYHQQYIVHCLSYKATKISFSISALLVEQKFQVSTKLIRGCWENIYLCFKNKKIL